MISDCATTSVGRCSTAEPGSLRSADPTRRVVHRRTRSATRIGPRRPHSGGVSHQSRIDDHPPAPSAIRPPVGATGRLADWLGVAGDLLLGTSCLGCGQPTIGLCPECRAAVTTRPAELVQPEPRPTGFPLTAAASSYDPILRQLITAHKDRQAWLLSGFLGDQLARAVQHLLAELDDEQAAALHRADGRLVLIPVPSSAAAVRRRGRDSTLAIARRAAAGLELDCGVSRCLRPIRRLADQSGLNAAERHDNLAGAFGASTGRAAARSGERSRRGDRRRSDHHRGDRAGVGSCRASGRSARPGCSGGRSDRPSQSGAIRSRPVRAAGGGPVIPVN